MATEHFSDAELGCHCGCGGLPTQAFQNSLERLRMVYGKPMPVSSVYRCPDYNHEVSTTGLTGPHTIGAADVVVRGQYAWDLIDAAQLHDWYGIGVSQKGEWGSRFIHIDRRPFDRRWIWSY